MVYQGKPSTGCKNCRSRRIKCDETRPHCNACTRTGRSCPGYPHPFDVMLRDQTTSFIKKPVFERPQRLTETSDSSSDANSHSETSARSLSPVLSSRSNTWPPKISPADLYQPMEDTVVPLFFNSYLYLPKDPHIRNGFMELLPELFSNVSPGSYLHTSTLAVAFFTVAAWTGQGSLLHASQRYFTQALPKIREALRSNNDNEYDSVLMSILMLSTYEEFVAIKDWETPMKAHLRGAIALINSRAKALDAPSSPTLHQAVQTAIIKTSRGLETPMVPTPKIWPLLPLDNPSSPRVFLSSAASQIVDLRQSWETLRSEKPSEDQILSILNKATQIDINLVSWTYWVPSHWKPVPASIIPQSVRNAGLYRNLCDCYSDMWIASTWNTYRDCRILVQNIMLNCLRLLPSDLDHNKETAIQTTIQKLADEICASVPFFLGSQMESVRMRSDLVEYPFAEERPVTSTHTQSAPLMGPWNIIAPLRNLQMSGLGLPPEQLAWVKDQMNRMLVIYFQK